MAKKRRVPPDIGYYLAGFADGEGSFNVSFRPRGDYRNPWKVSLCFNISQKDRVILSLFKRWLGCGTIRGRPDGVWYFEVNNLGAIRENVIPFFKRFRFLSAKKKRDFSKFCRVAEILSGGPVDEKEAQRILEIRRGMNDGGKRRYSEEEILRRYRLQESPEAIRQASDEVGR